MRVNEKAGLPGHAGQAGLVCLAETATAVSPVRADGIARELQPAIVAPAVIRIPTVPEELASTVSLIDVSKVPLQRFIARLRHRTGKIKKNATIDRKQSWTVNRGPRETRFTVHGLGPRKRARMSRFIAIIGILIMVQPV